MHLDLSVIASTTIKRKKPWPKLAWLGKGQGSLFLLDEHRISQLFLPSGKTRKKIPSLQPVIADAQILNISPNGLYLVGALSSGKIFVWHKDTESFKWTLVLDKIRNVLLSVFPKPKLFVSNCGKKVLLIFGINQIFLWEAYGSAQTDEYSGGRWLQVQCGDCYLPLKTDKEMAIDGLFYVDSVLGMCGACAWIFNRGDKIQLSTLKLQWTTAAQYFEDTRDGIQESPTFTAKWSSFAHSLYGLTSARRVLKSRKAYLGRFSPDGQVLAVAMNQKSAADNKVMFFNPANIPVAVIADLKGCGARVGISKQVTGRSWWVADMKWTSDSLFLVCITKRGSVAIVTKLGEPVQISVNGCSINMGPGLFLPLHPKILFKKPTNTDAGDSSLSTCSETDVLQQKFSVSVHPSLPVLLSSDGYLVTIIQLPSSLNPASVMNSLVADVTRLVPEIKLDLGSQDDSESRFSCGSKVNLLQSDFSLQPGGGEGDALSLQSFSSGSSVVPGYGLASGDQGVGFFGLDDTTDIGSLDGDIPVDIDCSLEARNITLMALGLATACAGNWKREYGTSRNAVTCAVASVFQLLIKRKRSHSTPVKLNPVESLKVLPRSIREFTTDPLDEEVSLEDALNFYKMALELFKWDSLHQNVLSWAVHLTGGITRRLLATKTVEEHAKVSGCLQLLKHAERLLTLIYYRDTEEGGVVCGPRDPPTAPVKQDDTVQYSTSDKNVCEDNQNSSVTKQRRVTVPSELPRSSVASQLSGTWLILYQYVSQACRKSHLPAREPIPGSGHSMLTYLCEVQRKLQELGVRIPSQANVESPSYLKGLNQYRSEDLKGTPGSVRKGSPSTSVVSPLPQDSMFARRRMNQTTSQDETRRNLDRSLAVALFHRPVFSKQLSGSGSAVDSGTADAQTMLSILYINLRQYEMRSAVDLVFSLLDPLRSLDQEGPEASTSFAPSVESSFVTSDHGLNTMLRILLQTYPMARVAEQRGMEVVQTLARVMAAYFSNLPLYIFPPYCPLPLPPYNFNQEKDKQDWETLQLSQSMEILEIDRTKVAKAVREQDLSEVWSANSALELMLVSGLLAEAAWLARNLGDWKHAFILSVAHYKFEDKYRSVVVTSPERNITFPAAPDDLRPDQIIMSRLEPMFLDTKPSEGVPQTNQIGENDKGKKASQEKRSRETDSKRQESDVDERLSRELSRILEASVVVGLDIVPTLLSNLIGELKARVTSFSWIVPQGFYLPSPPLYCPQPPYTKDNASVEVQAERRTRSDVVILVEKIITVLQSSRCAVPCVRWYTHQLVECSERWCGVYRDHGDFPVPPSLVERATTGFCFTDGSRLSPGKEQKKKLSPKKGKGTGKSVGVLPPSVCTVMGCFRELCLVMWLIHVRDEMSASARKYRRLRTRVTGMDETEGAVEQQCWETLEWTSRLVPYGEHLGCASDIRDALLTLISELPPLPSTAQVCAQFFHDPHSIDSISGKAKLKRLMAQFRSVSVEGIDDTGGTHEETLSMLYRRKCVEWQDEMKQRRKMMGGVREHVFETRATGAERPGSATKRQSEDPVGSLLLETDQLFFEFLDTFFIITFSKSLPPQLAQRIEPIPVLTPYSEHFLGADTRTLSDIRRKKTAEPPSKPATGSRLYRSHSFTDVRSSGFKRGNLQHADKLTTKEDGAIKRVSSLNDLQRLGAMSGYNSLGKDLLDLLPVLVWLNRWVYEGVTSAGRIFDVSTSAISKTHPLMRVHVPLLLTINCMWLLKNIYFPWVTKSEQAWKPEKKSREVVSEFDVLLHHGDSQDPSGSNPVADNPPSTLIGVTQLSQSVLRDDDIVEVSPAHDIVASSLHLSHLAEDDVQGAAKLQAAGLDVQGAAELQTADYAVPAIVVQSPTSDETTFPHPGASGNGGKQRKGGLVDMTDGGETETDLKKRVKRKQQHKQPSPKSISRADRRPRKEEDATPDVPSHQYRQHAEGERSKNHRGVAEDISSHQYRQHTERERSKNHRGVAEDISSHQYRPNAEGERSKDHRGADEEEGYVQVPPADVSASRTPVAMATVPMSKQSRRSAMAVERVCVSSNLLNNSDVSDATSWMSSSEANEEISRSRQTKSERISPKTSRRTTRKSKEKTETRQLQLLSQSGEDTQGDMEVFLVLRPKDGSSKSTTVRTGIPLVRLPNESTVTSCSEDASRNTKQRSQVKDAVSQTVDPRSHQVAIERRATGSQSQTESQNKFVQISIPRSDNFSTATQTNTENGVPSKDKTNRKLQQPLSKCHEQQPTTTSMSIKREISIATQTSRDLDEVMAGNGLALTSNHERFKGSIGTQTDTSISYESANVHQPETHQQHTFQFLKLEKPSSATQVVFNGVEPRTSSVNVNPYFTSSGSQVSPLNFGKPRIAWPSVVPAELPLLYMPDKTAAAEHRPDLSKIKFLETCPKSDALPLLEMVNKPQKLNVFDEPKLVKLDTQKPVQPDTSWPLLRFPQTGRSQKPDLSKMKLLERPELSEPADLPLLKFSPAQQRAPNLVPYEVVLEFEQSRTKRVWNPEEKENVVPAEVHRGPRGLVGLSEGEKAFRRAETDLPASQPMKLIHVQPAEIPQWENTETDQRNATSRQRRRNRIDNTDLEVNKLRNGPSRTRTQRQGHPRPGRTVIVEPQKGRKKPTIKKRSARPSTLKTAEKMIPIVGKPSRKKEIVYYESLSEESELELSKISDVVDSLSQEEKYFCVEASPQPSQPKSSILHHFEVPGPPVLMHYQRKRALEEEDRQAVTNGVPTPTTAVGITECASKGTFRLGGHIASKIRDVKRSDPPSEEFLKNTKKTSDKGVSVRFEDEVATPREVTKRRAIGVQVETNNGTPWMGDHVVPQVALIKSETKAVLVQTDETPLPVSTDQVNRRAPALPPDIFMNLKFPGADDPDADVDFPVAPLMSVAVSSARESKVAPQSVTQSTRQFLSVADIDHEEWVNAKGSPQYLPVPNNGKQGRSVSQSLHSSSAETRESRQSVAENEWIKELEGRSPSSGSEDVTARVPLPAPHAGPDSLTVRLMDSVDSPLQSRQRVDPRAASKQWITEHMRQMTQTMDAIEQVNDDMDRDLQSSRMLMNAIERLGEAVCPASEPTSVVPRLSTQEYSRDKLTRRPDLALRGSFDREETPDVEDVNREQEYGNDNDDSIDVTSPRRGDTNLDTPAHEVPVDTGSAADGASMSGSGSVSQVSQAPSDKEMEDESVRSLASSAESRVSSRDKVIQIEEDRKDEQKLDSPARGGKQLVSSSTEGDALQSFKISQDKLKEMLGLDDKTSNRAFGQTPEKRRELREWMNKKRTEQHSQWASKMEELRAAEYKPYVTEGVSSSKKIKLAEKKRTVKRREREGEHYEERMKTATNLLSDMLTEPIPEWNVSEPNLRYSKATGRSVRARSKKKHFNHRYKRKPTSMRSDRQQDFSKTRPGVQSHEITADLTDIDADSWRHSTPVWSVTDDIRQNDLIQKTKRRTPVPTAQEFVTVGTYRKHETEKLRKSKELDNRLRESYRPFGRGDAIDTATQDLFVSNNERPESPSGPNFITRKSWERYQKENNRRSEELQKDTEHLLRQYGELEPELHNPSVINRGVGALHASRTESQGGETLTDIDKLLEDIPDGSSMDEHKLGGLQSLLNEDSELKELLADVFDCTSSPVADHPREPLPRGTFKITSEKWDEAVPKGTYKFKRVPLSAGAPRSKDVAAERRKPIPKPRVKNVNRNQGDQAVGNALSHRGPKEEFDDTVSPWSTNDSLKMSDDVAQLLAEAKAAVGEDFSESSGSIMSNIDWQAVDKIMDEI